MEYGILKHTCLEEAADHPLKPVIITVRDIIKLSLFMCLLFYLFELISN